MMDPEFLLVIGDLIAKGLIRPTGYYKNGEMLYQAVPYAEMSDEAKAYAAYLESLEVPTSVN